MVAQALIYDIVMTKFSAPTSLLTECFKVKGIHYFSTEFNVLHYSDELFSEFGIPFPKELRNAVNQRKAEFLSGRENAKHALLELDVLLEPVLIGRNREPLFPNNIIGSISHSKNVALCVVGLRSELDYLGVDVEPIITSKLMSEIESQIITNAEKRLLLKSRLNIETAFTLVYSAKESLFKALHDEVRDYFDFDAALLIDINDRDNSLCFELTQTLAPNLPAGTRVSGQFSCQQDCVLTLIYKHRTQ